MATSQPPYRITFSQKFKQKIQSLKAVLKEVWGYGTGKAGLVLLIVLVSISIYAALTMPPNFVDNYWDNMDVLVENPTTVPPEWVKYFGTPHAPHIVVIKDRTDASNYDQTYYTITANYTLDYKLEHEVFPQGILIRLKGVLINETTLQGPSYKLYLKRPDGKILLLVRDAIKVEANVSIENSRAFLNRYYDISAAKEKLNAISILIDLVTDYAKQKGIMYYNETDKMYYLRFTNVPEVGEYNISLATIASMLKDKISLSPAMYVFGTIVDMRPVVEKMNKTGQIVYKLSRIDVVTKPLTGDYKLTLELTYIGIMNPIEAKKYTERPALEAKMIIKGSIFGFMGTDWLGRDLALGLLYGFPVAISIGLVVAVVTSIIGLLAGVVSGYYGGIVDELLQRVIDVMGNIPLLPILILIANIARTLFPSNPVLILLTILAILVVFGWGGLAIITRSMTLSIKEEPYIEAARALGAGNKRILFKHIIPQIIPYIVANMVFSVPSAILTEAGLSVIGIRHGLPTWGAILASANTPQTRSIAMKSWWWIIPPGLLISITSLTFVLLGMALERIVEPRFRTA